MTKVYFISEAGLNHNGDLEIAKQLITVASLAGSNAVKFQKRCVDQMATKDILDKEFTDYPSLGNTYREVRENLELTHDEYKKIINYTHEMGIDFIVTPFDIQSVDFFNDLNVDGFKVAAHSLTDIPLLERLSIEDKPIFISTGMCRMEDIELAVKTLNNDGSRNKGKDKELTVMHCVSQYPMNPKYANMTFINKLQKKFPNLRIGWSDHEDGILLTPVAVGMGATVIEKHITVDKDLEGFDHKMSLNPEQLIQCINNIRYVEKAIKYHNKIPMNNEMDCFNNYRRSIVAKVDINEGEKITRDMITTKAPNVGIKPKYIHDLNGKTVNTNIKKDKHIKWNDVNW